MENFNNKLQLLQKEDDINKKKKKRIARFGKNDIKSSIASSGTGEGGRGRFIMKLSTDPQSVAARQRRNRISDKFKMLQSLIPAGTGGSKMDTVTMLEEAIHYVKFLKTQLWIHHTIITNSISHHLIDTNQNLIHQPILDVSTTEAYDNNFINNLSLFSSSLPPPQDPSHQFLYSSSSTNCDTGHIPPLEAATAAAGISGMPLLQSPIPVPMANTFSPDFCCDHEDDT